MLKQKKLNSWLHHLSFIIPNRKGCLEPFSLCHSEVYFRAKNKKKHFSVHYLFNLLCVCCIPSKFVSWAIFHYFWMPLSLLQNCTYNYGAFYSNITKKLNSWQIRESSGSFKWIILGMNQFWLACFWGSFEPLTKQLLVHLNHLKGKRLAWTQHRKTMFSVLSRVVYFS